MTDEIGGHAEVNTAGQMERREQGAVERPDNERIEGRVAQILTEQDLIINRGGDQGVEVGMRFAVLSPKGQDIRDPDTGEVLDSVEIAKTFVKIVDVRPRVAVARTFRTIRGTRGALSGGLSALALFNSTLGTLDRRETLRTDERRVQQDLDAKDSFVKIGDPVVEVIGDNFPGLSNDIYEP